MKFFNVFSSDFKDVELQDSLIIGKIGESFTTEYRIIKDYNFIGIYSGNILENNNLEKLDGTIVTDKIESYVQEYTYVYEAPKGDGEELPPQTGVEQNMNYINYILLIAVVYILKKYFELINTK